MKKYTKRQLKLKRINNIKWRLENPDIYKESNKKASLKWLSNPQNKLKQKILKRKWYLKQEPGYDKIRARKWYNSLTQEQKDIYHKKHYIQTQKRINSYSRYKLKKHKAKYRELHFVNNYKNILPREELIKEYKRKKHKCAICKLSKKLVFDHCHNTNKFRGWICQNCNTMLGQAYDNVKILKAAIKYLS